MQQMMIKELFHEQHLLQLQGFLLLMQEITISLQNILPLMLFVMVMMVDMEDVVMVMEKMVNEELEWWRLLEQLQDHQQTV